uniref:D-lactate dehydrogenase (cytochrome) n=1 Tax=Timspurckia oligopyrenoides TaxID=708627 RepID=A0A7S0ZFJ0_9RHOD
MESSLDSDSQNVLKCVAALQDLYSNTFQSSYRFSVEESDRDSHSRDASFHTLESPVAVAYPANSSEVAATIAICAKFKTPVVGFGAGTSLEGHALPARKGSVTLNMRENMQQILDLNERDMTVRVQAGVSYTELNEFLRPYKLFFPPDPGAGATIGGMIATSCGGTNALKYGTVKSSVLSVKVVTADGKELETRRATRKSSAGYHLTEWFIGSEGTLGIITEATLQLHPIPPSSSVIILHFKSIRDAAHCASALVRDGTVDATRCELMDSAMVKAADMCLTPDQRNVADLKLGSTLLMVELTGEQKSVENRSETVKKIGLAAGASDDVKVAIEAERKEELWRIRKEAYWSAYALRPDASIWTTDVCVPLSRLAKCIQETQEDLDESGLIAPILAHAGDGNFHLLILINPDDQSEMKTASELNERLVRRALSYSGTCTGEHGVGSGKRHFLTEEYSQEALDVMRSMKQTLDPNGILNPDKIFPQSTPETPSHGRPPTFHQTPPSTPCAPDLTTVTE